VKNSLRLMLQTMYSSMKYFLGSGIFLAALHGAIATAQTAATSPATAAPTALPRIDSAEFAKKPYALTNGVSGTPVMVGTRNPADWGPLIKGELGKNVDITGQLFLPDGKDERVPAVIINPGSGSLGPHHLGQATMLTSSGIAALVLDPFFARSIDNTMVDQYGQISWATTAYDVLAAVQFLRLQPRIDGTRLGATGGSRGGTAAMMAAAGPVSDKVLGEGNGLRAVVAGYPWCGTQFKSARLAKGVSLLMLSGDKDDWVSVIQCQDAVHAMQLTGQDALMKIFPGARHAFDREGVPPTVIPQAVTSTNFPTVYMDEQGRFYSLRTGQVDATLSTQGFIDYSMKGGFMHKGVTIGTEGNQAEEYLSEMRQFFRERLLK
jgi:dienelactone hydrolase